MKRADFVSYLLRQWCYCRPDGSFSVFFNPATRAMALVPAGAEIPDDWGREVCRTLSVPEIPLRFPSPEVMRPADPAQDETARASGSTASGG